MTEPTSSQRLYEARINAAMDFVEANLAEPLSLAEMAKAASFSPFHFHRIFGAVVGETPSEHVRRVRTERSAALLLDQPNRTVSTIAVSCGFGTPSAFARTFKDTFGLTPSQWRSSGSAAALPARPVARGFPSNAKIEPDGIRQWTMTGDGVPDASISIEQLDPVALAYIRHTGPFQGSAALFENLFDRLEQQTFPKDNDASPPIRHALYHDDPELTADDRLRVSAAVPAARDGRHGPDVGYLTIPGGLHAVARFKLGPDDYGPAWKAVLGGWLPASGHEPSDIPYFERFPRSSPSPDGSRPVEICIPVQPVRT